MLEGYLAFLALKMGVCDYHDCVLSPPSSEIEQVWHAHLLDTEHYSETCAKLGVPDSVRILNRNPNFDSGADLRLEKARRYYGVAFGVPTSGVWAAPVAAAEAAANETHPNPPSPPPPAPPLPVPPPAAPAPPAPPLPAALPPAAKRQRGTATAEPPPATADPHPAIEAEPAPRTEGAPAPGEDASPPPTSADKFNLRVRASDTAYYMFKVRPTTPLEKVMAAYCQRVKLPRHRVEFSFDGQTVCGEMTPASLGMEDMDLVETQEIEDSSAH